MSHFTLYLRFGGILYNASSHTLHVKRTVRSHCCCVIIAIIINYYCYYSEFLEKTKQQRFMQLIREIGHVSLFSGLIQRLLETLFSLELILNEGHAIT
jgi:hypothetical protein